MVASLRHHGYAGRINLHATKSMQQMLDGKTLGESVVHDLNEALARDPGFCKVMLPSIIEDDATLYLDVDGIAMKDVSPLIEKLLPDERPLITQAAHPFVVGSDARPRGHWWVEPRMIIERKRLGPGARLFAVNTSAIWLRKGAALDGLQRELIAAHATFVHRDLAHKWGGVIPDELCVTTACAVLDIDPSMPESVCFFDQAPVRASEVASAAYVLPLYGSRRSLGSTSQHKRDLYDGQIRILRGRAEASQYASRHVMAHKFIDHPNT